MSRLTPEVISVVKATAPVVAENARKITSIFYKTMFKNNPEVLAFFNKAHQHSGDQPQALADAVVAYALHIDNLEAVTPLVAVMAHRHVALSVKPEHYGIVHKNLMIAIGEVLGSAVTPEIANAWSEAVLALADILIAAEEDLYKTVESREGGWRYERSFKVSRKEAIADDTVAVSFVPADGYDGKIEFTPGQYTTVRIPGLDAAPRHYTLTNTKQSNELEIVCRLVEGGVMSGYVHKNLAVGDEVLLAPPCGLFTSHATSKKIALISAGAGITPMLSMLNEGQPEITGVFHVEKRASRHPYIDTFSKVDAPKCYIYTEESGRPDLQAEMKKFFDASGGEETEYLVCGPKSFLESAIKGLHSAGATKVSAEAFGSGTQGVNEKAAAGGCPFAAK